MNCMFPGNLQDLQFVNRKHYLHVNTKFVTLDARDLCRSSDVKILPHNLSRIWNRLLWLGTPSSGFTRNMYGKGEILSLISK